MRYRTIMKGSDTGRLNRAEVRAAIVALYERRKAAQSGSPVQEACETSHEPTGKQLPGEAR